MIAITNPIGCLVSPCNVIRGHGYSFPTGGCCMDILRIMYTCCWHDPRVLPFSPGSCLDVPIKRRATAQRLLDRVFTIRLSSRYSIGPPPPSCRSSRHWNHSISPSIASNRHGCFTGSDNRPNPGPHGSTRVWTTSSNERPVRSPFPFSLHPRELAHITEGTTRSPTLKSNQMSRTNNSKPLLRPSPNTACRTSSKST